MVGRDDREFLAFASSVSDGLRRTAYLMCGDWHRAADLTQEALIRLYVAWPRLDKHAGLYRYARQTVVSVAIDAGRKRSNSEVPGASASQRVVEDPSAQLTDRLVLMQALAELPTKQRACVVLRYYEDLSVAEVASLLGCRPGTVKSQTARGLLALREAYRKVGGELNVGTEATKEAAPW
jgi:RNA polymerase sigma-70 factor (sigma-E family)